MKQKAFRTLFAAILFAVLITAPAFAVPTVNLNLINSPIAIGDTFQVAVWSDGDDIGLDFLSFSFDVSFDYNGVFDYTGYSLGTDFDDDSMFTGSDVAGSVFPGLTDDDVLLATLSFSVLDLGTDAINVTGLYDGMFSGMYYELSDLSLTGYDIDSSLSISINAQPVPEPATALLAITCLFGLVGANCRKRK